MAKIKILSANDVRQAVSMPQAIVAVREAYIQLSTGKAVNPLRTPIPVKEHGGITFFMSAYLTSNDTLGAKIVSVFPHNKEIGLPTIHAIVIIINAETGCPQAVMDGIYITALRTGAASGVATNLLARREAKVAAILGAGGQARTQLEAICTVRPVEKVLVYDCVKETAAAYVEEMKTQGSPIPQDIFMAESPAQAISEAHIICTATTSSKPVFENTDLKPGVHINGIGSFTPEMQEIPSEAVVRSKVVVDSLSACLAEAGDLIIPLKKGLINKDHIHGEIGKIAAGQLPGRESDNEVTLFKSVGLVIQDIAVAELVWRRSEELDLGIYIDL